MKHLEIQMIAASRGRSERAFEAHIDRLVKDLAYRGITDMNAANRYVAQLYLPAFNAEFMEPAPEDRSAFVPWNGENLDDILCEQDERMVGADNCVSFEKMALQISADRYRCHYVMVKVVIHRYPAVRESSGAAGRPVGRGRRGGNGKKAKRW